MSNRGVRSAAMHSLDGVNPTGLAVVAIVALINALRRTINFIFSPPFAEWLIGFAEIFVEGVAMGTLILVAVVWTFNRRRRTGWRQYGAVALAVIVSSGIGTLLVNGYDTDWTFTLAEYPYVSPLDIARLNGAGWLRYALIGLLVASAWLYVRAEADYSAALAQCAIDSARSDRQTAEARLRMLEAQIEPHFLFNTLAHVKRLYDIDPANGRRMLTDLMEYLAVALPQMRETQSTLGREVAHATAYLDIQRVRMGSRLAVDIDVPQALRSATMPSLMILTLVENAIKHGVGPRAEGGTVAIRASAHEGGMKIEVVDTGQGFAKETGAGTGLANIRGRLAALFGDAASLTLKLNTPHGLIATIALPRCGRELRDIA
jgi:signal transduction histidine kinase